MPLGLRHLTSPAPVYACVQKRRETAVWFDYYGVRPWKSRLPDELILCAALMSRASPSRNGAASSDTLSDALAALRRGEPVCILDAADREGETDMFFPAIGMQPHHLRLQRTEVRSRHVPS